MIAFQIISKLLKSLNNRSAKMLMKLKRLLKSAFTIVFKFFTLFLLRNLFIVSFETKNSLYENKNNRIR